LSFIHPAGLHTLTKTLLTPAFVNLRSHAICFPVRSGPADLEVQRDISVMGFDNTIEAFSHDLTSYNFNVRGATRAMLNHILHPRISGSPQTESRIEEIKGLIMERFTTAGIRKK
jgi:hypothetical protein